MLLLKNKSTSVGWAWLQCLVHAEWASGPTWFLLSCALECLEWGVCLILSLGSFLNLPGLAVRTNQCFKWNADKTVCLRPPHLVFCCFIFCWQPLQCSPTKVLTCKDNETIHVRSSLSATESTGDAGGSALWHSQLPCLTGDPGRLEGLERHHLILPDWTPFQRMVPLLAQPYHKGLPAQGRTF